VGGGKWGRRQGGRNGERRSEGRGNIGRRREVAGKAGRGGR